MLTAWAFPIASLLDAFFKNSHGLRFAEPISNLIPFFLFYFGILALIWAVVGISSKYAGSLTIRIIPPIRTLLTFAVQTLNDRALEG